MMLEDQINQKREKRDFIKNLEQIGQRKLEGLK